MYLPARFKSEDESDILEIIRRNPLATLISVKENQPFISHIPLVAEKNGDKLTLIGHFAKANPHWQLIEGSATAIFHGPNSYITPRWYSKNDVPTWNYAVVHLSGTGRLLQDYEATVSCLKKLTAHTESQSKTRWEFWLPDDLAKPHDLMSAIVGFEVVVDDIKAKLKLSQNRSLADRSGVIEGLLTDRSDENSIEVAGLMKKLSIKAGEL